MTKEAKRQKDKETNRQKDKNTKRQKDKTCKDSFALFQCLYMGWGFPYVVSSLLPLRMDEVSVTCGYLCCLVKTLISKRVIGRRWWLARVAKYPLSPLQDFQQTLENRSDARLNQLYCSCCCCRHGLGGETQPENMKLQMEYWKLKEWGRRWKERVISLLVQSENCDNLQ